MDAAGVVLHRDHLGAMFGEEPCRRFADVAKALHDHARAADR